MLTPTEKRFIKYWEEQRKGGRAGYYLLYILVGTFIATIIFAVVPLLFGMAPEYILFVMLGSCIIVTIATVFTWAGNEKKFKAIIQREIREGKKKDEDGSPPH